LKTENAVKFEKFIFDPWKLVSANRFGLLRVERGEEFAPIKNANPA
jgi:UDP-N-acetylglucosamine pyrophosphorylase